MSVCVPHMKSELRTCTCTTRRIRSCAARCIRSLPIGYPHPPPAGPPRGRVDPAREVLFGPITWGRGLRDIHQQPRQPINNVLDFAMMRTVRYSSRKGADDFTAVLVFESDDVAKWFVTTWNTNPRVSYEVCVARLNIHDAFELPPGYIILSRTRRPKPSFEKSWDSVAIVMRTTIPFKYREDFSGPDFMVIQINRHLIYNTYIHCVPTPVDAPVSTLIDSVPTCGDVRLRPVICVYALM
ncbi:hypothetical protein B0H14DRAFT_3470370 [Mycena olivaceomarginata]|nr:hypothetical protein B0H14DRAFT_3470370 [Mycena olivaceomarginata]